MSQFARIIDHPELMRDLSTQAILPIDQMIVRKHEKRMKDLQKESIREQELTKMKCDIDEIKSLIKQLINPITRSLT